MAHPLSSLRNTTTFPVFTSIDDINSLASTSRIWNLEHHTAYIGEITSDGDNLGFGLRVLLHLRDASGKEILLAFHDSARGGVAARGWKVGQTVMVLYPKRHRFMDGQVGFRIEDEEVKHFKIFPYSYKQLLDANDLYFKLINNPSTCSNTACSKTPAATSSSPMGAPAPDADKTKKLLFCARCGIAKYCSKGCQAAHWNAKDGEGHKEMCKVLVSVQWITKKKWGEIEFDEKTGWVKFYDNK